MSVRQWAFPPQSRSFPGQRWVSILVRTAHLVGLFGLWRGGPYGEVLVLSGLALVGLEVWSNGVWLLQLRGLAILLKLVLLAVALGGHLPMVPWLLGVIAISGLIAHAPARVRYYCPFHRRRIDAL